MAATGGTDVLKKQKTQSKKDLMLEESGTIDVNDQQLTERGIFRGSWKSNKMHGYGVFKWASGRTYEGNWAADLKSGVGVLTFKGGNEYAGEFLNDKREGYGYY